MRSYDYEYVAYAKGRWFGRTLLDVFTTEFIDMSPAYYVRVHLPAEPRGRARGQQGA